MKVTIDWLKEFVDFNRSAEEIAEQITLLGLEVDSVKYIRYDFDDVYAGIITDVTTVAGSDHLTCCQVALGEKTLQIVCGAPNVRPGIKVPVAIEGAVLPNNVRIKKSKIKGNESQGMICSAAELGLSNQSDIILELEQEIPAGVNFKNYLENNDAVIEIDVTANRPDCLGVIGVAREISTFAGSKLTKPGVKVSENPDKQVADYINVHIEDPENCPRYTARYIENLKVGPSPVWMVKRLEAVGVRSINNIVDITNYVMMETGQPLHAFDYDTIAEGTIIVRNARSGESFKTLDDVERKLDRDSCMICDSQKPVALGGIMGGLNSEIKNSTTRILLESAYFTPDNIRKTSRKMGLSTDSSQRFERGVDYNGLIYALDRAAALFCDLAGGTAASGYVDVYPNRIEIDTISLRVDRVTKLLGKSIPVDSMTSILKSLEFGVHANDNIIHVTVPSHRPDIKIEEDLIEEIARIYGYDRIEGNISATIKLDTHENRSELFSEAVRDISTGIGYFEIVTNTLIEKKETRPFCEHEPIDIRNPLSEDLSCLRTSLIPSALLVARWNFNRQNRSFKLFEIGNIFHWIVKGQQHHEHTKIVYLGTGNLREGVWSDTDRAYGFYDLKGDVEILLTRAAIKDVDFSESTHPFFDHRQMDLNISGTTVGCFGAINPAILKLFDLKNEVFVAELDFNGLMTHKEWEKTYVSVPKFPSISRDLSVLANITTPARQIITEIWRSGGKYLRSVKLYDLYQGKQIEKDKKSLTFSLMYFTEERTLTEAEVDMSINMIIESLEKKLDIHLRK